MSETINKDFHDLYEVCMNKDYETRPTAAKLVGCDII